MESITDGEYFKLCKILTEFPVKFREYYRMSINSFDYILDSVKDNMRGYYNFRKCSEAGEELMVALRYVPVIVVRIKIICICKMFNATIRRCNLK